MKQAFKDYCVAIGLSEFAQRRVDVVLNELSSIYEGIELNDIFINELNRNGERTFQSIWFFSDKHIIECKDFLSSDDYDLAIYKDQIQYFNITKKDFSDIENPSEKSSITIHVTFGKVELSADLTALGINCKYALSIAKKYFIKGLLD